MKSHFRLTSMELASFTVLALAATALVTVLAVRDCNGSDNRNDVRLNDSIECAVIQAKSKSNIAADSLKIRNKGQRKKKNEKVRKQPHPHERQYLDEEVD